jgi:hypothetical protein
MVRPTASGLSHRAESSLGSSLAAAGEADGTPLEVAAGGWVGRRLGGP